MIRYSILILVFMSSCIDHQSKISNELKNDTLLEEKAIIQTFADVDSILAIDNGKFWAKQLYGPIIFINPETRVFYANENNAKKDFAMVQSIYSDTLPVEINIANTAIDWDDKRWSMVILPLPKDKISRNNLVIHELFHRLQPEIGFGNLLELDNGHLDAYEGRLLLKLELQALNKAVNSKERTERLNHIQNALSFRNARYKNQEIIEAENSLELNEGLAEYTAIMLSGRKAKEMNAHLSQSITDFYANPTFVRSFAYQTIPLYGYLLSNEKPNWHQEVDKTTNLATLFQQSFGVEMDTKQSVQKIAEANGYDFQQIDTDEQEREKIRIEKIIKLKVKFMEEPTLELLFQNMNISFDPSNITPLENMGTVYPTLRVSDDWGILTVENGALLASDWSRVIVTAPTEITDELVIGNGWKLEVNHEWKVLKESVGYKLKKK